MVASFLKGHLLPGQNVDELKRAKVAEVDTANKI